MTDQEEVSECNHPEIETSNNLLNQGIYFCKYCGAVMIENKVNIKIYKFKLFIKIIFELFFSRFLFFSPLLLNLKNTIID